METRPYIPWDLIESFMIDVFVKYGVPKDEAAICADVLLEADRQGIESHGCNRFKPIYIDRFEKGTLLPETNLEILNETDTTLVMDAHDGMGMVASYRMMEKLIEKAGKHGMAGGAVRNSTHYGIAGYWTNMAAKAGMVG
ncbi:MAG: Ldh family oxidoreductase, partial [Firmicutes bacterium]|nr:Ldh family oxidoreductase [Bacillota bacterium]